MMHRSRYLECGKIINTHGCRGDVKVEPWTDTPRDLIDLGRVFVGDGESKREIKILRGSVMQGRFLLLSLVLNLALNQNFMIIINHKPIKNTLKIEEVK